MAVDDSGSAITKKKNSNRATTTTTRKIKEQTPITLNGRRINGKSKSDNG